MPDRGVRLDSKTVAGVRIAAGPVLVEVLIRKLVANAVACGDRRRHGGQSIARYLSGDRAGVTDDGSTLGEEDIARLVGPPCRGAWASAPGTSFGLSIVGPMAGRSRAELRAVRGEQGWGLRVEASFPA